ncbi:MAG: tetratricopeptide repeat protein [Verrucomicrobia bacterium]|nr:tetratricopeptide repeat protein [Verrucomicrobiota bacterium]
MRLAAIAAILLAALAPASAVASEWDDYLAGKFQNFVWDDEVRTGYEAYAAQDYEAAAEALTTAIDKGCKDPVVVFRAAYALRATGQTDKAAGYFTAAAAQFGKARTDHHYRPEAHYYLAEFYVQHAKHDEAEWELEQAIELRKNFAEAYLLYGDLFTAQGKYAFAAEKYRRAHEVDPKSTKPLYNLAVTLVHAGKLDDARAAIGEARKLEPENDKVGLLAATIALAAKDLDGAHAEYAAIYVRNAGSIDALLGLGYVAWRRGEFDEAATQYAAVLELEPDHIEAVYGLGLAEAKLAKTDEAIGHLLRVIEIQPNNKNAHYNLGSLYQNKGDFDKAIEQYGEVMKLDPNDRTPNYNLGVIFIRMRRYAEAQTYLEEAVEAFGADTQWGRAAQQMLDLVIQIRQDRPVEVEKELEKLDKGGPAD